jgi:hypothetical protein
MSKTQEYLRENYHSIDKSKLENILVPSFNHLEEVLGKQTGIACPAVTEAANKAYRTEFKK